MDLGNRLGHLTCSPLVHAGDNWAEMVSSLLLNLTLLAGTDPQRGLA